MNSLAEKTPLVSIIIPTWRDSKVLNKCLESLLNQNYPKDKFEIILVSQDMPNIAIKDERIRFISNVGYSHSRNEGAKSAKGEFLAFADDDCVMPSDWILSAMPYFDDEKIVVVGGPAFPFPDEDFRHRVGGYLLSSVFSCGFASCRYKTSGRVYEAKDYSLITANNFMRKNVFELLGGFDSNQTPASEENDFYFRVKKLGYKMLYVPEVFVWHRAKPIFFPLFGKVFFYATGRGVLISRKPETIKVIYLIPTFFIFGLLAAGILAVFSKFFLYSLAGIIFAHVLWNIINGFYVFFKFERRPAVFLASLAATPFIHFSYGLGILFGIYQYITGGFKSGVRGVWSKY